MSLSAFIILVHHRVPVSASHPGSHFWKNGGKKSKKMTVTEDVHFVSKIKNSMYDSATLIVDFANEKMIKNRYRSTGIDYNQIVEYLDGKYPDRMEELRKIILDYDTAQALEKAKTELAKIEKNDVAVSDAFDELVEQAQENDMGYVEN